jgi:hypothetical protein
VEALGSATSSISVGSMMCRRGVVGAVVWANLPAGNLVDLRRLPGRLKAYSRLCCGVISRRSPAG